jgi:hypothetical protein
VRVLRPERHSVAYEPDGTRGVLVLALDEPPKNAPVEFYKAY